MFLNLESAAKMLRTKEETLKRWVKQGNIISHRINNEVKFDLNELKRWACKSKIEIKNLEDITEDNNFNSPLTKALENGFVSFIDAQSLEESFRSIISQISENLCDAVDPEKLYNSLMERERIVPTIIKEGVSIPHPKVAGEFNFKKSFVLVAVNKNFIQYPVELDEESRTIKIQFFIFSKSTSDHLKILAEISKLCFRCDVVKEFDHLTTTCDILQRLVDIDKEVTKG